MNASAREEALDGLYLARANTLLHAWPAAGVVHGCQRPPSEACLCRVQVPNKTDVRPVYHRTPERGRARNFLCALAYYVKVLGSLWIQSVH